jgi:hypothetical protein
MAASPNLKSVPSRAGGVNAGVVGGLEFFVDLVALGLHASVKDAGDDDAFRVRSVEDYVLPLLDSMQARLDFIAGTAEVRIAGEPVATCLKGVQIAVGLRQTPL